MEGYVATEALIIGLLLIGSIVAIGARRLRVPYTVALVVVGLLITFGEPVKISLTPQLILALFIPPLVFEAAFHIDLDRLRSILPHVLVLAVPGVVLTTGIVGLIVAVGLGLPWGTGLMFGALISATDPVAVVALFRSLDAPKRLSVLVESESLLNDGTSIVIFNLILASVLASTQTSAGGQAVIADPVSAVVDFIRVSVGGVGIGVGLGWLMVQIIARVDDYLIETMLTTVLAFGSYLVADWLGVSGVLAVVGAGIVAGNMGPKGMSPTTRIVLYNFWEYLAFAANSLVFLLIGLQVNIPQIAENIVPIIVGVAAVLASRAIVVYGLTWLAGLRWHKLPMAYQHVLFWGGLRGAISLALALSLPAGLADRQLLQVMAFGVILFTLLGQGTTIHPLLHRLGLIRREEATLEYERRHGRLMAAQAARRRLQKLHRDGAVTTATIEALLPDLDARIRAYVESQRELLMEQPALRAEELQDAQRASLQAQRAVLSALFSDGLISQTVYEELVTDVDTGMDNLTGPGGQRPS